MAYMKLIEKLGLYEDRGFVELWDLSACNGNEHSRIYCVTRIAGMCYGQVQIKNPEKLYKRLWDENASTLEFIRMGTAPTISKSLRNNPTLPVDEEVRQVWQMDRHRANIATFRVKVPIFVARQVMRHRQFSYQELSRRYTTNERVPLEFWMPPLEEIKTEEELQADIIWLRNYFERSLEIYDMLMIDGLLAEDARAVLPQAAYTQFWMQGNAPAWKNYFKLRTDSHAQKEHRELATAMLDLLQEHQPELYGKVVP